MAPSQKAEIVELSSKNTTGPYGARGCDETLHMVVDGEDVFVPFTNVRASGFDYHGDVPEGFDVDRIVEYNGRIHAEADVEGGVVELCPDYNAATAEFRGYDRWTMQLFDADAPSDSTVIWEREEVMSR